MTGSATSFYTYKSLIYPYAYRPLRLASIQNGIEYSSLVGQILTGISKEEINCGTTTSSKSKPIRVKVEDLMVIIDIASECCYISLTKLSDEQVILTLKKMGERRWKDYIQIRFVTVE
jgi:hypothetical protein